VRMGSEVLYEVTSCAMYSIQDSLSVEKWLNICFLIMSLSTCSHFTLTSA